MEINILDILKQAKTESNDFVIGNRNSIKTLKYNNLLLNLKTFKIPNFFTGLIYRYFRQSKAKRSFLHAEYLISKGIGTPNPIGFYENKNAFQLLDSYYVCEHIEADYVFKDLFQKPIEEIEPILKQFANFCFKMHENGIDFLDHSPGNTLITNNNDGTYNFFLVDLNRMKFHSTKMDLSLRMKNICRITPGISFIEIISKEYAKLSNNSEQETFNYLFEHSTRFFKKFDQKKKIKGIFKI